MAPAASALALVLTAACSPADGDDPAGADAGGHDGGDAATSGAGITAIAPDRSPLAGGDEIDIQGYGFGPAARVYFGAAEAEVSWRAGTSRLTVVAPPASAPGPVDVRVVDVDASAVWERGFAYLAPVSVASVEPAAGSELGGTPVTIRGSGFRPGDRVLIGQRQALHVQVLDETTILAITPATALPAGQDMVTMPLAVRHASGLSVAASAFAYGRAPRLDRVEPAVVAAGGGDVQLHGQGLGSIEHAYFAGRAATLAATDAGSMRGATASAAAPGALPRLVAAALQGPYGAFTRDGVLLYAGGAAPALLGVVPAEGSTAGGATVSLLADLAGAIAGEARIGGQPLAIANPGAAALTAPSPALPAGVHDVSLQVGSATLVAKGAYRAWAPVTIAAIEPDAGPLAGGNTVRLRGAGLVEGCSVRIGALPASVLGEQAGDLLVRPAAGAAGAAVVRLRCGPHEVVRPEGYRYLPAAPQLDAVLPAQGATAGGAVVQLIGAGLDETCQVRFGGAVAAVQELSNAGLRVKVPARPPGPVTVAVLCASGSDALVDGYVYASPVSPQGGTHGGPAQGALHVSVLDIYTLKPIGDALVVVGLPGDPTFGSHQGKTNKQGQVVFSGLDLVAPLTVSASKVEYSASSIVSFSVSNATLLLFPWVPPSPGGGGGGGGLPLATLKGRVLDLDKYVLVPPTSCLKPSTGGPICDFCATTEECGPSATWACALTGGVSRRCFPLCQTDDDCDQDYRCSDDVEVPGRRLCRPSIGIRTITCQTSTRGLESENPPPGPGAVVDEKTGLWSISSRLDELAVYCVAGYLQSDTTFVPTSMGVRRHIFPIPGGVIEGLDLRLDIPLQRTLSLRLDRPQRFFPAGNGGAMDVRAWLDLGSDGYIPIANVAQAPASAGETAVADLIAVPYQPLSLPEALTDVSQTWRAVVSFGDTAVPMETGTQHDTIVRPGDGNLLIRSSKGDWDGEALGLATPLASVLRGDGDEVLLVSDIGRLWRGTPTGASLIYVPTLADLYDQPPAVLAAAGTPTDATIVGAGGMVRRLQGDEVTSEAGALLEDLVGVCHMGGGPGAPRVVVGAKGGVAVYTGAGWKIVGAMPTAGRTVACSSSRALIGAGQGSVGLLRLVNGKPELGFVTVPGAAHVAAASALPDGGWLVAGGTNDAEVGGLWRIATGDNPQTVNSFGEMVAVSDAWPAGCKLRPRLRALIATGPQAHVGLGERGELIRLDALGCFDESPQRLDLQVRAGVALDDGRVVVVGTPGLWLGPFLTVPAIAQPQDASNPKPLQVAWTAAPGPLPAVNRVHLDGQGFPFWWLYTAPTATQITLPDLEAIDPNIQLFLNVPYVARVDRIWTPTLSIDAFSTYDLEFGPWRSWSTNGKAFQP